ncbi:unnamed protein product [Lepeophtheirus salmonis]|uniref:(salmon louse) hypothetical protein n=1 Tax=Lepeophtheirus salmonis TaxID=72036 RepID=A0A7R8CNB0_LEPSM|nr:unnamed protein product [Lepeophtheirus salmonis]CAF2873758.1 unnamed protein product [Lepeophtheirus salmonis]
MTRSMATNKTMMAAPYNTKKSKRLAKRNVESVGMWAGLRMSPSPFLDGVFSTKCISSSSIISSRGKSSFSELSFSESSVGSDPRNVEPSSSSSILSSESKSSSGNSPLPPKYSSNRSV